MKNLGAFLTADLIVTGLFSGIFFLNASLDGYGDTPLLLYYVLLFFVFFSAVLTLLALFARLRKIQVSVFNLAFLFGVLFISFIVFFVSNYSLRFLFPGISQPTFYSFPRNLSFAFGAVSFICIASFKSRVLKRLVLGFLIGSVCLWTVYSTLGVDFLGRGRSVPRGLNVLLLTIESLRYDSLGCSGNRSVRSPSIDYLAQQGIAFDNYFVQVPYTTASVSSLLTGCYPFRHGSRFFGQRPDSHFRPILEDLAGSGYLVKADEAYFTSLFPASAGFHVEPASLTGKAFDHLKNVISIINDQAGNLFPSIFGSYCFGSTTSMRQTSRLLRNIRIHKNQKWFFWTHFQAECHWPYESPPQFTQIYREGKPSRQTSHYLKKISILNENPELVTDKLLGEIRAAYFAEVTSIDRQIGFILSQLKRFNCLNNTIIILTGDHGEMLGENRYFGHGEYLRDELIHVPLFIYGPGTRYFKGGSRIHELVEEVDIAPTIMDLCGQVGRRSFDGKTLTELWRPGGWDKSLVYSEVIDVKDNFFACLRSDRFKFVWDAARDRELLYEINEPGENADIAEAYPQKLVEMKRLLLDFTGCVALNGLKPVRKPQIDRKIKEKMKALGYIK
jgi:arylsulfatase A-like enzyme